ncbi:hypothetical protein DH2020_034160 [Rehmannia glutinosa]|uniref:RRM domain-containing protein n=1 Tax=Rehmannia glutinosa TaxID=99300 RepID=A0ABR0VD05_REHGL
MAAGAEVSGEAAVVDMVSPAAAVNEPLSPKKTIPSENNIENFDNSNSVESGETDVTDGHKDSDMNSNADSKSELQMKEIVDMLKKLKLNPMAKEFFPSSYNQGQMGVHNFDLNNKNLGNDGFPNHRRRRNNYNQGRKRMSGRAFRAQREDSIRRTVYVSDIDHNITEEQLAGLFSGYGLVVDCRVCGDPHSHLRFAFVEFADEYSARAALCLNGTLFGFSPVKVLPSKTAILPVNPTFLPRVSQADVKNFFETRCGEVSRLRLLGDQVHSTRIAFVEFFMAESAIVALDCCGEILGSQRIRWEVGICSWERLLQNEVVLLFSVSAENNLHKRGAKGLLRRTLSDA